MLKNFIEDDIVISFDPVRGFSCGGEERRQVRGGERGRRSGGVVVYFVVDEEKCLVLFVDLLVDKSVDEPLA